MSLALVCSANSVAYPEGSYLLKLFGDPDDYAYKLGNDTFRHQLPIQLKVMYFKIYDFFHSISIDYASHLVYYGNNALQRLEYGWFVQQNDTSSYGDVPDTHQVTKL